MAALKVFGVPELAEMIFLQVSYSASRRIRRQEKKKDNYKGLTEDQIDEKKYAKLRRMPKSIEPLTTLARLHLVCRDFKKVLEGSSKLQREMFANSGCYYRQDSTGIIMYLLKNKIGGILDSWREDVDGENWHDLVVSPGVSYDCDDTEIEEQGRGRRQQALEWREFVADDRKWNPPTASWRRLELRGYMTVIISVEYDGINGMPDGEPSMQPLSDEEEMCRLGLHCDGDYPYASDSEDDDAEQVGRCKLGDVFKWYAEIRERATAEQKIIDNYWEGMTDASSESGEDSEDREQLVGSRFSGTDEVPPAQELELPQAAPGTVSSRGSDPMPAPIQDGLTKPAGVTNWVFDKLAAVFPSFAEPTV